MCYYKQLTIIFSRLNNLRKLEKAMDEVAKRAVFNPAYTEKRSTSRKFKWTAVFRAHIHSGTERGISAKLHYHRATAGKYTITYLELHTGTRGTCSVHGLSEFQSIYSEYALWNKVAFMICTYRAYFCGVVFSLSLEECEIRCHLFFPS